MKKIINSLVVSVLLIACLFMVGCVNVPKDFKDARSNLLKAHYKVESVDDFEEFLEEVGFFSYMFFTEKNFNELAEEYYWLPEELIDEYERSFEKGIAGGEKEEFVFLAYFEDNKSAKNFYNDVKDLLEEASNASYNKEVVNGKSNLKMNFGRDGKVVYFGTEGALEDVKG